MFLSFSSVYFNSMEAILGGLFQSWIKPKSIICSEHEGQQSSALNGWVCNWNGLLWDWNIDDGNY